MNMIGPATSSGEKTTSAQICTMSGYVHGFEINPPSTGYATIKIYDSENSTTTGKLLLSTASVAAGQNALYLGLTIPRVANRGIYVALTGTTSYVVAYSLG